MNSDSHRLFQLYKDKIILLIKQYGKKNKVKVFIINR
jgi:hypothetical protein